MHGFTLLYLIKILAEKIFIMCQKRYDKNSMCVLYYFGHTTVMLVFLGYNMHYIKIICNNKNTTATMRS